MFILIFIILRRALRISLKIQILKILHIIRKHNPLLGSPNPRRFRLILHNPRLLIISLQFTFKHSNNL